MKKQILILISVIVLSINTKSQQGKFQANINVNSEYLIENFYEITLEISNFHSDSLEWLDCIWFDTVGIKNFYYTCCKPNRWKSPCESYFPDSIVEGFVFDYYSNHNGFDDYGDLRANWGCPLRL